MEHKWIAKIKESEEWHIRELLEEANKSDKQEAWQNYENYLKELGKRYGYDPRKVSIDTKGRVFVLPGETVFVVYNKVTHELHKVFYIKKTATDYVLSGSNQMLNLTYEEVEIE